MRYQPEQFYLRSAEEMKALFAESPRSRPNTRLVAEQCNLQIEFGGCHYPVFTPRKDSPARATCVRCSPKAWRRYGLHARVEGESSSSIKIEDPSCSPLPPAPNRAPPRPREPPLPDRNRGSERAPPSRPSSTGSDSNSASSRRPGSSVTSSSSPTFVRHGRSMGISCVARGSAAGSLVTYLLEIANVDPIRYGLLFERFLNPERVNPPDIDIDFADDRRADVIEYVREKYGDDCVAQIITFGTMGAKSVIRDVGPRDGPELQRLRSPGQDDPAT
jgi:DNA polymerase-3 subunit alpha